MSGRCPACLMVDTPFTKPITQAQMDCRHEWHGREDLTVGEDHPLVEALANPQLTPQQLGACVVTVSRLFKALDEVVEKMYRPKTRPPPEVVVFCQLLKEVLTRQLNEER